MLHITDTDFQSPLLEPINRLIDLLNAHLPADCYYYMGGGAFRDLFLARKPVHDLDFFFADKKSRKTFKKLLNDWGIQPFYQSRFTSRYKVEGLEIDIVHLLNVPPPEWIAYIDVVNCAFTYDRHKTAYFHRDFFTNGMRMQINNITDGSTSDQVLLWRYDKHVKKGFYYPGGRTGFAKEIAFRKFRRPILINILRGK